MHPNSLVYDINYNAERAELAIAGRLVCLPQQVVTIVIVMMALGTVAHGVLTRVVCAPTSRMGSVSPACLLVSVWWNSSNGALCDSLWRVVVVADVLRAQLSNQLCC